MVVFCFTLGDVCCRKTRFGVKCVKKHSCIAILVVQYF